MTSARQPVRLIVEIDRADPLHGTIAEPDQAVRTFNGWTAFASVIAAAVRRIEAPPERRPGQHELAGD